MFLEKDHSDPDGRLLHVLWEKKLQRLQAKMKEKEALHEEREKKMSLLKAKLAETTHRKGRTKTTTSDKHDLGKRAPLIARSFSLSNGSTRPAG